MLKALKKTGNAGIMFEEKRRQNEENFYCDYVFDYIFITIFPTV